ncbi:hypothetical protein VUR80DRAFT_3410 [Thermomyces stellatus]
MAISSGAGEILHSHYAFRETYLPLFHLAPTGGFLFVTTTTPHIPAGAYATSFNRGVPYGPRLSSKQIFCLHTRMWRRAPGPRNMIHQAGAERQYRRWQLQLRRSMRAPPGNFFYVRDSEADPKVRPTTRASISLFLPSVSRANGYRAREAPLNDTEGKRPSILRNSTGPGDIEHAVSDFYDRNRDWT